MKMSISGQSSMLDALVFFGILMVAALVLTYTTLPERESGRRKTMRIYCKSTLESLLRSTINHTTYKDPNSGDKIHLDDKSVEELVVEDLYLRSHTGVDKATLQKGIEEKINATLQNLTAPHYHYNFTAWTNNASFTLRSHPREDQQVISATQKLNTPNKDQLYTAGLKVWIP